LLAISPSHIVFIISLSKLLSRLRNNVFYNVFLLHVTLCNLYLFLHIILESQSLPLALCELYSASFFIFSNPPTLSIRTYGILQLFCISLLNCLACLFYFSRPLSTAKRTNSYVIISLCCMMKFLILSPLSRLYYILLNCFLQHIVN
jgi:hypothetical protein